MIKYEVRVYANGEKHWYLNGKLHREDGPAMECAHGDKHWYLNGKRQRVDGPAIEWSGGGEVWYLNDEYLTEQEHKKATTKSDFNAWMITRVMPETVLADTEKHGVKDYE